VASLYMLAFLIMDSLFLIHKSIPVKWSPKITYEKLKLVFPTLHYRDSDYLFITSRP
jgi:hypothetical protein